MVIAHVHHRLNQAGQRYFLNWLQIAADRLRRFEGYISIRQLVNVEHPDECHLLLEFESLSLLRRWASSPAHDELIALLDPFRTGPLESTVFEAKPVAA
jgi:antibiotic biosynthesis monooxygenase (ABM) superfamily enzyme